MSSKTEGSSLPNFLYPSTLEKICGMTKECTKSFETKVFLSAIFLCQCVSRKISNRKFFLDTGFSILKQLEEEATDRKKHVVWYNLGRAYHQFSILGMAERFYRKSLETKNRDLKRMAIFNLALIYKNSGSATLHSSLLQEWKKL